jgi:hypothetical protein
MQTLDFSGSDFNCDILGAAANAVGIPRAVWTKESIEERNESILDQWPWLAKQIPVEGRDYYQTRFVELSRRFDQEDGTVGDLLNYIRYIEPECGGCNDYDCTCARVDGLQQHFELKPDSQVEGTQWDRIARDREVFEDKASTGPKDVREAPIEGAPQRPCQNVEDRDIIRPTLEPWSQNVAADGLNLDELPPSMRRAVMANRIRLSAKLAAPSVEAPRRVIEHVMKDTLWLKVKKGGLGRLDIWKRATHTWFSKLTLTQILLIAILAVLVAVLLVVWQRTSGYPTYFRSAPRSHHYRWVPM